MGIVTREMMFDYNVNEAIKRFKDQTGINLTGEQLQEDIWEQRSLFGEIMLEIIQEVEGDEIFE